MITGSSMFLIDLLRRSRTMERILQIHGRMVVGGVAGNLFFCSRILLAVAEIASARSPAAIAYADVVFSGVDQPNTFVWNTMIRIHAGGHDPRRSMAIFCRMRRRGVQTDHYTYPFLLKSCGIFSGWEEGTQTRAEILKRGWGSHVFVMNALISFCCRCREVEEARKVFDELLCRDLVSWNAMISGYAAVGKTKEALELFEDMPEKDAFSCAIIIDAYGKIGDVNSARELFDDAIERVGGDIVTCNSMVAAYAGAGRMEEARKLFESMEDRTVISWSILIVGYSRHGEAKEALNMFQRMLSQGIMADKVASTAVISACAKLGSLDIARRIYLCIRKNNIPLDVAIQTAMADMFMKCGSVEDARSVFNQMPEKNAKSWNVMILGLGSNGYGSEALDLFHEMENDAIDMDEITYLAALTICANSGRLDEGLAIFNRIKTKSEEHFACLADLLGRSGKIEKAMEMLEKMPHLYGSLLAACSVHRRVDLAEICVQKLEDAGEDDVVAYVMLSNLYAECGSWDGVRAAREKMKRRRKKEAGKSVVEGD